MTLPYVQVNTLVCYCSGGAGRRHEIPGSGMDSVALGPASSTSTSASAFPLAPKFLRGNAMRFGCASATHAVRLHRSGPWHLGKPLVLQQAAGKPALCPRETYHPSGSLAENNIKKWPRGGVPGLLDSWHPHGQEVMLRVHERAPLPACHVMENR